MTAPIALVRKQHAELLAFVERLIERHSYASSSFMRNGCRCESCKEARVLIKACKPQEVTA